MRRNALLSVLLLLVGASAFAETLPTYSYAAMKLGVYLPQAKDVEEFKNTAFGELSLGHSFHKNFAVELGVGYTKTHANVTVDDDLGGVPASGTEKYDLTVVPITLGVRGSLPTGNIEPFATAGIGLYYAKAEVSGTSFSENDTAFGYYLGLGANYHFTRDAFLGVEGKYFWAKPEFDQQEVKIDGITLTANIGYRF